MAKKSKAKKSKATSAKAKTKAKKKTFSLEPVAKKLRVILKALEGELVKATDPEVQSRLQKEIEGIKNGLTTIEACCRSYNVGI